MDRSRALLIGASAAVVVLLLVAVAAFFAFSPSRPSDSGPTGPSINVYGVSNPVTWGMETGQWATIWCSSDATDSAALVEVLSSKGVVATVYDGGLWERPVDPLGHFTFPAWDGKDGSGKYLPSGNYQYRIRLTYRGASTEARGELGVFRLRFVIQGTGSVLKPATFKRYLYQGPVLVSYRVLAAPGTTYVGITSVPKLDDGDASWEIPVYTITGGSPEWTATSSWARSARRSGMVVWTLFATSDQEFRKSNGSVVQVTVTQ